MTRNASNDAAAAQEAPPEEEHIGTFYAFRYPNFRLLWLGDLFTAAAWWMQTTATVWVVYTLTGSGQAVGGINAIRIVPTLLLTSIAGVISDRYNRNRIIAISQIGLVLCTFLVAFLLATGSIQVWHLFVFTVIVGVAQTFNMPARQAFVFELVPRRIIPNAVALSWFAFSTSRAVGPAIGGGIIVFLGAANNYFLQSLAYFGVLVSILLIRAPARPEVTSRPSFWQSLRDGYGFVLTNPEARVMVIMSIISPLLIIPVHMALFPIFAEDTFHTGAAGLGILAGSVGIRRTVRRVAGGVDESHRQAGPAATRRALRLQPRGNYFCAAGPLHRQYAAGRALPGAGWHRRALLHHHQHGGAAAAGAGAHAGKHGRSAPALLLVCAAGSNNLGALPRITSVRRRWPQ